MTDPTVAVPGPKKLRATVTLVLPEVEADPQVFQANDLDGMVKSYKKLLENDQLFDWIEGPYEEETLGITAEIEVV